MAAQSERQCPPLKESFRRRVWSALMCLPKLFYEYPSQFQVATILRDDRCPRPFDQGTSGNESDNHRALSAPNSRGPAGKSPTPHHHQASPLQSATCGHKRWRRQSSLRSELQATSDGPCMTVARQPQNLPTREMARLGISCKSRSTTHTRRALLPFVPLTERGSRTTAGSVPR